MKSKKKVKYQFQQNTQDRKPVAEWRLNRLEGIGTGWIRNDHPQVKLEPKKRTRRAKEVTNVNQEQQDTKDAN